jgi:hypothetical protein
MPTKQRTSIATQDDGSSQSVCRSTTQSLTMKRTCSASPCRHRLSLSSSPECITVTGPARRAAEHLACRRNPRRRSCLPWGRAVAEKEATRGRAAQPRAIDRTRVQAGQEDQCQRNSSVNVLMYQRMRASSRAADRDGRAPSKRTWPGVLPRRAPLHPLLVPEDLR